MITPSGLCQRAGGSRAARLVSAAILFLAASCGRSDGGTSANLLEVAGAKTALATRQAFTETVDAIGTVQPRIGHVASLGAPGPTRVSRVYVATGQHVVANQALVELDRAAFQAATQSAAAAVRVAEQNAAREQRLAREGIVPRKNVEQAAADLARAQADLVAARRASELSTLRTPISGVVTSMRAVLGAPVDANQPLVEVADPRALDVVLGVTTSDAARVRPGMRVTLSAGQSAGGEPLGTGRVVDVSGTVDTASRAVAVRVRPAGTRRELRIGETVFGRIVVAEHPNAVTVPQEALVPEGETFKVFVVDAAGLAHSRVVTIGAKGDSVVEITSGLRAGERVVTYGAYGVTDSARILPPRAGGDTAVRP